jgi:hypothetical protein
MTEMSPIGTVCRLLPGMETLPEDAQQCVDKADTD